MKHLLSEAGRSFLRAFLVVFVPALIGLLNAPSFGAQKALAIAALIASVAAGLKAVQVFVPQLSFAAIVGGKFGPYVDSFARAAIGAFLVSVTGWLSLAHFAGWHAFLYGALTGALAAGVRAIQGFLTKGESPAPAVGLVVPGTPERAPAKAA